MIMTTMTNGTVPDSVQVQNVMDFVQKGGVMMIPIGLCSLIALTVIIERLISLRRKASYCQEFVLLITLLLVSPVEILKITNRGSFKPLASLHPQTINFFPRQFCNRVLNLEILERSSIHCFPCS